MQLSGLAQRSGISAASIKFYLREGLLLPGDSLTATRAEYNDAHLERLRLIRRLRQVVGLGLREIGMLTGAIDNPEVSTLELLRLTQSLVLGYEPRGADEHPRTTEVIKGQGWPNTGSDARDALNALLHELDGAGISIGPEVAAGYAAAADQVARQDLGFVVESSSRDRTVETVAVGVHSYGRLLVRMLALAQTSHSIRNYSS